MPTLMLCIWLGLLPQISFSKIKFGEVSTAFTMNTVFPSTNESYVMSMQQDQMHPDRIVVATETAMYAIYLTTNESEGDFIIGDPTDVGYREGEGGNARFNEIAGIVQTTDSYIISDLYNHCLRQIQPYLDPTGGKKWKSSTYAGKCEETGAIDGRSLNARFYYPNGLIAQNSILIIADQSNRKIRQLDMRSGDVTTLHESMTFKPFQIVFGKSVREFYYTTDHGIIHVQGRKETWLVGSAKANMQTENTQFSSAGFSTPQFIAWLRDDLLLVTDWQTDTVRVVNLALQEVNVICPQGSGYRDGNNQECMLEAPRSLLVKDNEILIGELGRVRKLPYQHIPDATNGLQCGKPPEILNSKYMPRNSYPTGAEVFYRCIDGYTRRGFNPNILICTNINNDNTSVWVGEPIKCQLSTVTVAVIIIAIVFPITMLGLVIGLRKSYRICKLPKKTDNLTLKPVDRFDESSEPQRNNTDLPREALPSNVNDGYYTEIDENFVSVDITRTTTTPNGCSNQSSYISPVPKTPRPRENGPYEEMNGGYMGPDEVITAVHRP